MLQRIFSTILVVVGLLAHSNAFAAEEANRLELPKKIEVEYSAAILQLPILLTNEVNMTGFQCDLYLPEGFSIATDEYGDYLIDLARTTTKRHSLATRVMSDGALRIVLSSMTNATFSGNSGDVLNITVKVGNDIAPGSYNVNLKNIVLTDPNAIRYTSDDVTGTIVRKEQPVTVTAQNLTMVYGDEIPALTYTSEGAELKGVPLLSCDVTPSSPVGTYPIVVSKGTVVNKEVTYVNGTLTITKAPLKVFVGNYTKKQYDPMPDYVLSYDGFMNGETEAVLRTKPIATTSATVSSAPGEYDIVVSGGDAQNYTLSYQNGKLTVTEPDSYTLTYMVDGKEYQSFSIKYKDHIVPLEEPFKEGYTFSGWSEIPETMPAKDVVVTGTFTVNSYTVTFMYGDKVLYTEEVNYGETIPIPEIKDKYGLVYKWLDVPETMPAHDVILQVDETDMIESLTPSLSKGKGSIYDHQGRKLPALQKGLNIIRMSDGTSKKVMTK